MIKDFKHKGLKALFNSGKGAKVKGIAPDLQDRCIQRLDLLDDANRPEDMNVHGLHFHALQGNPKRYSVRVNANWRITFEWEDDVQSARRVDLEDYH